MKIIRFLLGMLVCGRSGTSHAQDYIAYQQLLNRCDNEIIAGDLRQALLRMDSLDRGYTFIFARHCMKGLQLACRCEDEGRAVLWMQRAFLQGVPVWAIRSNGITRNAVKWLSVLRVLSRHDSLHAIYRSRIDTMLARRVGELIARDYRYTRRVNDGFVLLRHTLYGFQWKANNRRQIAALASLIGAYGFPEERLIGLPESVADSAAMYRFARRGGIDLLLQNRQAFFMFLHYYSTKRTEMSAVLRPQIAVGNLPAYQFARISDYQATSGRRARGIPYHESLPLTQDEDADDLDRRRAEIGLSTYLEGSRNRDLKLRREFSGTANEELILE